MAGTTIEPAVNPPVDIEGRRLIAVGAPLGVPFDPEDAPAFARELDTLCSSLKCARPSQVVFAAEFAVRRCDAGARFWPARRVLLVIGWPLLQVLDADELRVALALALSGEVLGLGASPCGAQDSKISALFGRALLQRTLSRLLAAHEIGAQDWFADWNRRARREAQAPRAAFAELRRQMEARGRGGWQQALERAWQSAADTQRLADLGGPDLSGGSHRCAASAMFWDGLVARIWTALEAPFDALLAVHWEACYGANAAQRERARALAAMRREARIEVAELIELAQLLDYLAGPRAAYPIYQEAFARERNPTVALALARSLISIDRARAHTALTRLAGSSHAIAAQAQQLLHSLSSTESAVALPAH